jgi:hypothetical protein
MTALIPIDYPIDHAHDRPSRLTREIPEILGKLLLRNVLIATLNHFNSWGSRWAIARAVSLCAAGATLVQAKFTLENL